MAKFTTETKRARGFFGIGVYYPKSEVNIGTLWRTADIYGAAFIFTVGPLRYRPKNRQASDTTKAWRQIPLQHYADIEDLVEHLPCAAPLIGIEQAHGATQLAGFEHPESAVYMLGAEDNGIPSRVLARCHYVVEIPSVTGMCLNVATAGSIVCYDRFAKLQANTPWLRVPTALCSAPAESGGGDG